MDERVDELYEKMQEVGYGLEPHPVTTETLQVLFERMLMALAIGLADIEDKIINEK